MSYVIAPPDNLVHIRWMIRRDMPQVMEIGNALGWDEEEFIHHLRQRNCIGMVAERFETILGYMLYELNEGELKLLNMAVHPDHRRSRIGSQMITHAKRKLITHRRRKLVAAVSDANLPAHLLFHFNDFKTLPNARDVYHFVYETNGEDEHAY
jgi:[ribosomal protein S18]-alanine N-acetyltransferase